MRITYKKNGFVSGRALQNVAHAILNDLIKDFLTQHNVVQEFYFMHVNKDRTYLYLINGDRIEIKHN